MSGWVNVETALDLLAAWLEPLLPTGTEVLTDAAPEELAGPTVVLNTISAPRWGAPLAGLGTAEWSIQATSIAWDPTSGRSLPQQARYLGGQVAEAIAGTTATGTYVRTMTLTGLTVLRRQTAGDGNTAKGGRIWSHRETFTLTVTAT